MSSTLYNLIPEFVGGHETLPSESIYYNRYPYRLRLKLYDFNAPTSAKLLMVSSYRSQVADWARNFGVNSVFRLKFSHTSRYQHVYFEDINDLEDAAVVFSDIVIDVSGPKSKDHLDLLLNNTIHIQVRKQNFYNKFNTKLRMHIPYRMWLSRSPDIHLLKDTVDFMIENLGEDIRLKDQYRSLRTFAECYVDFDAFMGIYPFIKLQFPDLRLKIFRVVLDK